MTHDSDETSSMANAAEVFARKHGSSRDLSHIFIGAAHALGIPARFVGGYCRGEDGGSIGKSGHAWAEAFVPELGWIAFDPANGFCPTDAHVRVAIGLDAVGAAPVRGTRYGPWGGNARSRDQGRAIRPFRCPLPRFAPRRMMI